MVIQCEIWADNPQLGINDTIVAQVSAARQGLKQLGIRLTMAGSVASAWFLAACNPWLRLWPLSKLAHLSAFLLALHGETASTKDRLGFCAALGYLEAALASEHGRGSMQGCHRAS